MTIISIEALSHGYGERRIFADFGLQLERGEHSLLLGPSGAGKSTLINLVTGLLTPDAGRISIDGEAISTLGPSQRDDLRRRKIGVIFQTLRLVSALSVTANLQLAQRLAQAGRDDAAISGLLDAVGIAHRAHARPRELSQGEAQRAAIARALVGRPALIVADEPTSALDDANAMRIGQLLLDTANKQGATLLIATHDARLKSLIDRVIALAPAPEMAA